MSVIMFPSWSYWHNSFHVAVINAIMLRLCCAPQERDLEEREREAALEAFRKKVIEEERMRMLREHGPNLIGYLPKVCLLGTHAILSSL